MHTAWRTGTVTVRFNFNDDSAARVLQFVTHSVPRPNYYLPTLTELKDEASDVDYLASTGSEEECRPRMTYLGPEPGFPLSRRPRSYKETNNTSPTFQVG